MRLLFLILVLVSNGFTMTYTELDARQRAQVKKVLKVLANNIPKGSEKLVTDFDQLLEYGVFPEMLVTPQAQKTVKEARENLYYVVAGECAYNKFFFLHEGKCEGDSAHQKALNYGYTYESYLEVVGAMIDQYAQDQFEMVLLNIKALQDHQKAHGFGSYFYLAYEATSLHNLNRFKDAKLKAEEFFEKFPEVTLGTSYEMMKSCLEPVEGRKPSDEIIMGYDIPFAPDQEEDEDDLWD